MASFTITKLSWLHRSEPDAWRRLAHVVLPHDWITSQLTGRLTTDRGDASGTGYWSAATGTYRDDLLAIVDDRDWSTVVPTVLGPTEAAGEWRGAVVGPGTGDNMAGALGVGLRPGDVAISIGTSGTVYAVSDTPTADPSGIVAGFADATGRHLPLVCTLNATKVTDAVARLLGVDHDGLDALALAAAPGAGGLTPAPVPRRRAHAGPADGHRCAGGAAQRRHARAARPRRGGGRRVRPARRPRRARRGRRPSTGASCSAAAAPTRRRTARCSPTCAAARCVVPRGDQQVATGACVQAAAVATGAEPADIADRWELGAGDVVEPGPGATAAADVRAAYAAVRDATAPA